MNRTKIALETIKNLNLCGICTGGDCQKCSRLIAKEEAITALKEKLGKEEKSHGRILD